MDSYMGAGSYPKWGTHTVEVDLQSGPYRATIKQCVGGNCLGKSVIKAVMDEIEDRLYQPKDDDSRKHCVVDSDGYAIEFILVDNNGDALFVDDSFDDLIVGARIVAWEPEENSKPATEAERQCMYCESKDVYSGSDSHGWVCADCLSECEPITEEGDD